jgi:hypothetical protein
MRVLLILLTVYLLFRIFFNFVLPLIARYFFAKAAKNMQGQFNQQQQQQRTNSRREGEVRIETPNSPQNQRNRNFDEGEFVDYTEVK